MAIREASDLNIADAEEAERAAALRARIRKAGMSIADFRRKSGLSRNVVYALSKGRKPRPDEEKAIENAFRDAARHISK